MPAEQAKRVICACIREIHFFRDFMGLKDKNFLGFFWLGIFIQDNLPVNLKQEVWPISQLLAGTERKNDQFSQLQAAAFAVPLCKEKQC